MADVPAAAEDVTGEVRSSLAPSKPQRTASMRDQATSQPILKKHGTSNPALNQDYEAVAVTAPPTSDSLVTLLLNGHLTNLQRLWKRTVSRKKGVQEFRSEIISGVNT